MQRRHEARVEDLAVRLTNIDLNLLPPLLALLQERSVTGAAQRVGLSQPAMSHSLARLRVLLGDDLLVRVGRTSKLTPRGSALVEPVQLILSQVSDGVLHIAGFTADADAHHFALSMSTSTALVVSPVLLQLIDEEAPAVTFEVVESATAGSDPFAQLDVDLALLADSVTTTHDRRGLYMDRWVAVVWKDNPVARDVLTVDHLKRMSHVAYRSPTVRTQAYVAMAAAGIQPHLHLVTNNFLLIPMLVMGTDRLAVVQERLARKLAEGFRLQVLDLPFPVPPLGIDVVLNPRLVGDAATSWLIGAMQRHLGPSNG